jgi:tmRNA-binding protein
MQLEKLLHNNEASGLAYKKSRLRVSVIELKLFVNNGGDKHKIGRMFALGKHFRLVL